MTNQKRITNQDIFNILQDFMQMTADMFAQVNQRLGRLEAIQDEHTTILNEHSKILNQHSKELNKHSNELARINQRLDVISEHVRIIEVRTTVLETRFNRASLPG